MFDAARKPDKPNDPPYGGHEDKRPKREDHRDREVKEPPNAGTAGSEEKFPRKGEV
jgi:hypothetical protein